MAVDGAGEHLVAGGLLHRHRLTGDRRLVDVGATVEHRAVERHALARRTSMRWPGQHAIDRHHAFDAAIARSAPRPAPDPAAARIAARARSTLRDSSHWATAKRNTTIAASSHSPMSSAPATATTISALMSSAPRRTDGPGSTRRKHAARDDRGEEQWRGPGGRADVRSSTQPAREQGGGQSSEDAARTGGGRSWSGRRRTAAAARPAAWASALTARSAASREARRAPGRATASPTWVRPWFSRSVTWRSSRA